MEWFVSDDTLEYTSNLQLKPVTRRGILSVVGQLYDPLLLLTPFTLQGKHFLHKINQLGLDWDEEVPGKLKQEWER